MPARPRLRGVLHQHAFFAALAAAALLIAAAPSAEARLAAAVYALGLCGLLGTSALYHRVTWSAGARRWMRRLDHSMIFVLIAATITPVAVIVLNDPLRTVLLAVAWGGALAGAAVELLWPGAPKWVVTSLCLAIGWAGVPAVPQLVDFAPTVLVLLAAGGILYTVGAVIYALGRPDPLPSVFGYHEVFHAFVIAAATLHFAAVGIVVL